MQDLSIVNSGELTMSSREIASLTGKRHGDVIRDIRTMLEQMGDDADLRHVSEQQDQRGYTSEFLLDRYHTEVLVTGYDVKRRAAVIRRWFDLETGAATPTYQIPQTMAEALRLAADQAERIEQQERELEQARPAVEFTNRVIESDETIRIGEVAKIIGTGQNRLFKFLRQHGFLTRRNEPYQSKIDAGLMDVKLSKQFEHPRAGLTRSITPLVTGKGLARIQRLWAEEHAGEVA